MEPSIGRSIGQGFRAANRSWAGMAVFAGIGVLAWVVIGLLLAPTKIPAELFRPLDLQGPTSPAPAPAPQASPAPTTPKAPPEAAGRSASSGPVAPKDLFSQLSASTATPGPSSASSTQAAPARGREEALEKAMEERINLAGEWLVHAWPAALLCLLIALTVGVWLQGGRIGYLAKVVSSGGAGVSELWTAGLRSFGALLGGWFVSITAFAGVVVVAALLVAILSALFGAAPAWVRAIAGMVFSLAFLVGLVWLAVRLAFWFIAIVVDRVGPVGGLWASFRATQGRWWAVFGLGALVGLITFGVEVVLRGAVSVAGRTAVALILIGIPALVARLYVGFAALASFIHFYTGTKSAGPSTDPGTP